jgi:hypothetical protein
VAFGISDMRGKLGGGGLTWQAGTDRGHGAAMSPAVRGGERLKVVAAFCAIPGLKSETRAHGVKTGTEPTQAKLGWGTRHPAGPEARTDADRGGKDPRDQTAARFSIDAQPCRLILCRASDGLPRRSRSGCGDQREAGAQAAGRSVAGGVTAQGLLPHRRVSLGAGGYAGAGRGGRVCAIPGPRIRTWGTRHRAVRR